MKILPLIPFLFLGLSSCNEKPQNVESEKQAQSDDPIWASPVFPKIETYVNHYVLSPTQGTTATHDLSYWSAQSRVGDVKCKARCGYVGEIPYTLKLTYKGTQGGNDHYLTSISYPLDSVVHTGEKSIIYQGEELDIFKDHDWRIGIRPYTNN